MGRIGLISDVHGDVVGLELAWAHAVTMGADEVVCAGDVVGYGPKPNDVIAFLAERQIKTIRGNHDRWAIERGPGVLDEFGGNAPDAATVEVLRRLEPSLVLERDGRVIVVVHGSPRGDMEFVTPKRHPAHILDGYLTSLKADVLVHGHTHRPSWFRSKKGGLVINPGSVVSPPVVETSRTFALLDCNTMSVTFHDVESGRLVDVLAWPGSEPALE